ncbi:hypothetical protein JRQ81_019935 [Phrynocephalus forsythii]|uniref:Ig-like domain-containing protein n=1 Tax=Phrynocephalus forsythii TaxID=171643 RepID=A0A9Q1AYF8_9SAUR|nr:hypothetical protein JRQ81_019935 [Phrynocephalus forsythii]
MCLAAAVAPLLLLENASRIANTGGSLPSEGEISLWKDKVQKVMAKLREEARLPCSYKIPQGESMKDYKIYWQTRGGLKPLVAIAYINATESSYTDPLYKNRTKMNEENFTLSIFPVKLSDECTYECVILKEELITKLPVALSVVADFSKPIIQAERHSNVCGSEWLTLTCSSHGGYPRPRMVGSINNETVEWNSTATHDAATGLFQIIGNLPLNVTGDILVHCSVEYQDLKVSANFTWCMYLHPRHSNVVFSFPNSSSPDYWTLVSNTKLCIFMLMHLKY